MLKRTRSFYGSQEAPVAKRARTRSFRSFRQRRYKTKVSRRLNGIVQVPRIMNDPFPTQRVTRLRYCTTVTLDAATPTVARNLFRANSIYDPDQTGTGHQPYGHDTLATIYNHYEVIRSYITCVGVTASMGQNAGNAILGILLCDDTTTPTTIDLLRESKDCNWDTVSSYQRAIVSNSFDRRKVFPNEFQALGAAFGANPSEESYFLVWAGHPANDSVEGGALYVNVTIDYVVRCWELKDLGQS